MKRFLLIHNIQTLNPNQYELIGDLSDHRKFTNIIHENGF